MLPRLPPQNVARPELSHSLPVSAVVAELPFDVDAGEQLDVIRELVGRLAVGDHDARAASRAELCDRDAGQRQPDHDHAFTTQLRHRTFSVPSASNASSAETSQNRTMIFG